MVPALHWHLDGGSKFLLLEPGLDPATVDLLRDTFLLVFNLFKCVLTDRTSLTDRLRGAQILDHVVELCHVLDAMMIIEEEARAVLIIDGVILVAHVLTSTHVVQIVHASLSTFGPQAEVSGSSSTCNYNEA